MGAAIFENSTTASPETAELLSTAAELLLFAAGCQ